MDTQQKHPSESRLYNFDFSQMPEMRDDEDIATVVSMEIESKKPTDATDIDIVSVAYEDKRVQVRLADGDDGATYVLKTVITTNAMVPNTLVGKGKIEVRSDL